MDTREYHRLFMSIKTITLFVLVILKKWISPTNPRLESKFKSSKTKKKMKSSITMKIIEKIFRFQWRKRKVNTYLAGTTMTIKIERKAKKKVQVGTIIARRLY
jgi:hypothetical protein